MSAWQVISIIELVLIIQAHRVIAARNRQIERMFKEKEQL